jgi:hypothetical protein
MIYTKSNLKNQRTLCRAQCCDLKVWVGSKRVWLCREGDGVTIERLNADGRWEVVAGSCFTSTAEG